MTLLPAAPAPDVELKCPHSVTLGICKLATAAAYSKEILTPEGLVISIRMRHWAANSALDTDRAAVAGARLGVHDGDARGLPDPSHCAADPAAGFSVWRAAWPRCLVRTHVQCLCCK